MVRDARSFQVNRRRWFLGQTACNLYRAADVTCSTASIFLLTAISMDK
jgi:7 transmembrane receptor (rhodopsin family)